jgi:hypothetical protein
MEFGIQFFPDVAPIQKPADQYFREAGDAALWPGGVSAVVINYSLTLRSRRAAYRRALAELVPDPSIRACGATQDESVLGYMP